MKKIGVILAAGFGTRLRPSTLVCPKPLIPVAGVEPLFFALFKFYEMGVRTVFINSHYLRNKIEEKLKAWKDLLPDLEMIVSYEPQILGTGGALLKIFSEHSSVFKNAQMILQNGDTLAGVDLNAFSAKPDQNLFAISLLSEHLKKYKPLWIGPEGHWTGIGKAPPTQNSRPAHFLGVHSLSPQAISCLQEMLQKKELLVEEVDLFNGIYRPLVTQGFEFSSVEFFKSKAQKSEFWFDMTSKEFLLEAQKYLLNHLGQLKTWQQLLKTRFPGCFEASPGIWRLGNLPHSLEMGAPALLLVRDPHTIKTQNGKLTLGPHSALIFEGKELELDIESRSLKIENGVLYIQTSSPLAQQNSKVTLSKNLEGELFVQ